jgi:hypothetical protein
LHSKEQLRAAAHETERDKNVGRGECCCDSGAGRRCTKGKVSLSSKRKCSPRHKRESASAGCVGACTQSRECTHTCRHQLAPPHSLLALCEQKIQHPLSSLCSGSFPGATSLRAHRSRKRGHCGTRDCTKSGTLGTPRFQCAPISARPNRDTVGRQGSTSRGGTPALPGAGVVGSRQRAVASGGQVQRLYVCALVSYPYIYVPGQRQWEGEAPPLRSTGSQQPARVLDYHKQSAILI